MDPHIVKAFDEELRRLDDKIAEMGGRAEAQLADAIAALVKRDPRRAAILIERDREIDSLESEINVRAVRLLALRQPVADDLRTAVAALKISHELERIGDQATNIAESVLFCVRGETPPTERRRDDQSSVTVLTPIRPTGPKRRRLDP